MEDSKMKVLILIAIPDIAVVLPNWLYGPAF